MFSTRFVSVLAAAATLLSMASADSSSSSSSKIVSIAEPTATLPASSMTTIGCFATGTPLEDHGYGQYASSGKCQLICLQLGKSILGLSEGTNCWCGDLAPPKEMQVDDDLCSTTCSGTEEDICGGKKKLWVMTTGKDRTPFEYASNDTLAEPSSSSRISSSTTTAAPSQTADPTTSAIPAPEPEKKSSKVGIAVGVVVGVVALLAIIGGVFFWLRQKKRREVEEEYRRQAAVNSFTGGGKLHTSNSSMTDSRLDPDFMNRRQSNGSIADNEDYSRRILKVTNA